MSTIFGVLKSESKANPRYDDNDELLVDVMWEDVDYEFEKVAIRFNGEGGEWINPIADLLPDNTKVWALDNTPQGIYFIKDLKELIK